MPKNKDLKRHVRARMAKTGESYAAARANTVAKTADFAEIAGMSDDAVHDKTGKNWRQWVAVLDRAGARSMAHKDIASMLHTEHGVPAWWAQMVTVAYERIRGLRDKGQRRGGGYVVNKSKTLPVSLDELYAAFGARRRKQWFGDGKLTIKTSTKNKSMRVTWADGTPVDLQFYGKGASKSQVTVQHRQLPSKKEADAVRADWTERLAALAAYLG